MHHVNAGDLPGNEVSRTFEGGRHGPCSVSFFLVHNQPGQGPRLHHHPYDETFVILEGRVRGSVGGEALDADPDATLQDDKGLVVGMMMRSEEHTSELQSHSELACRLL